MIQNPISSYESTLTPLLRMGYRPFFFGGSVSAILLILLWVYWFSSGSIPQGFLAPIRWHSHEMIFGFSMAVIAGFLLTASANWTQTRGEHGFSLGALFLVWILGRLLLIMAQLSPNSTIHILATIVDLAFIPHLIFLLAPPLIKSRQLRNINFLFILSLFFLANLLFHLEAWGKLQVSGMTLALHLVSLLLTIIGGRVIPFFTQNALPDATVVRFQWVENLLPWVVTAVAISDLVLSIHPLTGWLALLCSLLHSARLFGWKSLATRKNPLLWILHLGYFWLALFYVFVFLSDIESVVARSISWHALTIGAMSTLIIGMISRVSLGHSGRPLILKKGMLISYTSILAAAVVRVSLGFWPQYYVLGIQVVACLWIVSFGVLLFYYCPIYFSPRADGRHG
jgi:uncharacterized protein involved in response to NO